MQRRDHWHAQPVEKREDVVTGFAAEDAELVLERDHVVPAVVENICRVGVVLDNLVANLEADHRRIVVGLAVVGHRDDAGFEVGVHGCDGVSQVGREGRDAATARQGVSDEGNALEAGHVRTSGAVGRGPCGIVESAAAGPEATPAMWDSASADPAKHHHVGLPRPVSDKGLHPGGSGLQSRRLPLEEDGLACERIHQSDAGMAV